MKTLEANSPLDKMIRRSILTCNQIQVDTWSPKKIVELGCIAANLSPQIEKELRTLPIDERAVNEHIMQKLRKNADKKNEFYFVDPENKSLIPFQSELGQLCFFADQMFYTLLHLQDISTPPSDRYFYLNALASLCMQISLQSEKLLKSRSPGVFID